MHVHGRSLAATPILTADGISTSSTFYQRLGFRFELFDGGYGIVSFEGIELFHIVAADPPIPGAAYLNVPDADEWHAKCSAIGVPVTAIEDRPWSMREFIATDPAGDAIRIGTNLQNKDGQPARSGALCGPRSPLADAPAVYRTMGEAQWDGWPLPNHNSRVPISGPGVVLRKAVNTQVPRNAAEWETSWQ